MKLFNKVKEFEDLSILSNKELIIENGLIAMQEQWNDYLLKSVKNPNNVKFLFHKFFSIIKFF